MRDGVAYITHTLLHIADFNKKYREPSAWIPLSAKYLRFMLGAKSCKDILWYCLIHNIIEKEPRGYCRGRCQRYRLAEHLIGQTRIQHRVETKGIRKKYLAWKEKTSPRVNKEQDVYGCLAYWLHKVEIDVPPPALYDEIASAPPKRPQKEYETSPEKRFSMRRQSTVALVGRIQTKDYSGTVQESENGHRYFSVLSSLNKRLRRYLSIGGERLAAVDIANSQPLFLALYLRELLNEAMRLPIDSFSALPPDFKLFYRLCENGEIYEHLMRAVGMSREKAKKDLLTLFYCPPHWRSKLTEVFASEFPTVWEAMQRIKQAKGYKALSHLMQKTEADFVIRTVCERLRQKYPDDIPIVTLHDSIVTVESKVNVVQLVMEDEFRKLDISPQLKIEKWALE